MKSLSVLVLLAATSPLLSACGPSANASSLSTNAVNQRQLVSDAHVSDSQGTPTAAPMALHAVRVQQYEDRTPRDINSHLPGVVTLIEFEADVCETDLIDGDFTIALDTTDSIVRATVIPVKPLATCDQPKRQQFHVSTSQAPAGRPIAVTNPLIVDPMPPSY